MTRTENRWFKVARDVKVNDSDIRGDGDGDGGYENVVEGRESGKRKMWM